MDDVIKFLVVRFCIVTQNANISFFSENGMTKGKPQCKIIAVYHKINALLVHFLFVWQLAL